MNASELEEYFEAKAFVDERSLHEPTKSLFLTLARRLNGRVLDLGCGSGKMLQRLLEWGIPSSTTYVGVDSDPKVVEPFEHTFDSLFRQVQKNAEEKRIEITAPGGIQILLYTSGVESFLRKHSQFDVITSCSLFDLVDVYSVLPLVYEKLTRGGYAYSVCNFDGETRFEPVISSELDEKVVRLYHDSMRQRNLTLGVPGGEYRSGRKLGPIWERCGGEVVSLGSSDWVICPRQGGYHKQERYVLQSIINFVEQALNGSSQLGPEEIDFWIGERQRQLENSELILVAHNVDFLGTK
jgi:SAM-dependent methyltransferase